MATASARDIRCRIRLMHNLPFKLGGRTLVIAIPFLWLSCFFIPFLIVLG
jgi:hypothetical protein